MHESVFSTFPVIRSFLFPSAKKFEKKKIHRIQYSDTVYWYLDLKINV